MSARALLLSVCMFATGAAAGNITDDTCHTGVVLDRQNWGAGYGKCCNQQDSQDCFTSPCAPLIGRPLCLAVPDGKPQNWAGFGPCADEWDTGYCGVCPNCTQYNDTNKQQSCKANNALNNCKAGEVQTCSCPWTECHPGKCTIEQGSLEVRCTASTCKLTKLAIGLAAAAAALFLCCVVCVLWICCRNCCSTNPAPTGVVYVQVPGQCQPSPTGAVPQAYTANNNMKPGGLYPSVVNE